MVNKLFYDNYKNRNINLYVLENEYLKVGITDFGGAVQTLSVKTPDGERDICLGYKTVKDYLDSLTFCGAIIGRVGNRIRNGKFTLNGIDYNLSLNDGKNHLHGGIDGFDKRFFDAKIKDDSLILTLTSVDGDQGYPGELKLEVTYTLNGKSLDIAFSALSNKDTLWNPTSHIYFNLNGEESGNICDTELKINANAFTPCDSEIIPTGEIKQVENTHFDFTAKRNVGKMLAIHGGYDDNFILNGSHAATARGIKSGITIDVYTDLPAMQFYSGNFIKGSGKSREYSPQDGFCLEPQFVPDAINMEGFEKPVLKANEKESFYISYKFDY